MAASEALSSTRLPRSVTRAAAVSEMMSAAVEASDSTQAVQVYLTLDAPVPLTQFAYDVTAYALAAVAQVLVGFKQATYIKCITERFFKHLLLVKLALQRSWYYRSGLWLNTVVMLGWQWLHLANGLCKELVCGLLACTRLFGCMGTCLLCCTMLVNLLFEVLEFL